jgi:hypothetical protein
VITHASGVIGLELFGSLGWGTQLEGILLTDKTTSTLYYPHVASDDYWWTGIVAYNPSSSTCTITITPYSAQGTALPSSTFPIAGKGKYVGAVAQLGLPAQTAWFKIDSTNNPFTGFELFGTTDGQQLGAYAGGGETGAKEGIFAKIEKNGWTGIAFVNTEAAAASVTLTAYSDAGAAVATEALPVGGHAKVVNNPELIFSQDISNAKYIAYSSDRNVVGFQLNGNSDGTMLDGLPGLATPTPTSTPNAIPVANAGPDQTVFVSVIVKLDGSISSDVDGNPLTFSWSFISRPFGSTATLSDPSAVKPTFTIDLAGTYAIQLIVNDGFINSSPDTVTISTPNSKPIANAGPDQAIHAGVEVFLDGKASSDADGNPLTYAWSFMSRPPGSKATLSDANTDYASFISDKVGDYIVQLIVNDDTVDSEPDTVVISAQNLSPTADAGPDQMVFTNPIYLSGSASSDGDGDPLTYSWSFLSRPIGSIAALSNPAIVNPTFVADKFGYYTVQLIVNDGTVNSAPDEVVIRKERPL